MRLARPNMPQLRFLFAGRGELLFVRREFGTYILSKKASEGDFGNVTLLGKPVILSVLVIFFICMCFLLPPMTGVHAFYAAHD